MLDPTEELPDEVPFVLMSWRISSLAVSSTRNSGGSSSSRPSTSIARSCEPTARGMSHLPQLSDARLDSQVPELLGEGKKRFFSAE